MIKNLDNLIKAFRREREQIKQKELEEIWNMVNKKNEEIKDDPRIEIIHKQVEKYFEQVMEAYPDLKNLRVELVEFIDEDQEDD
jgi:NifB/MoaA-like Fe-S oxidoreductase